MPGKSFRAQDCVKVEVAVLGSPSRISLTVFVDVKQHERKRRWEDEHRVMSFKCQLTPLYVDLNKGGYVMIMWGLMLRMSSWHIRDNEYLSEELGLKNRYKEGYGWVGIQTLPSQLGRQKTRNDALPCCQKHAPLHVTWNRLSSRGIKSVIAGRHAFRTNAVWR